MKTLTTALFGVAVLLGPNSGLQGLATAQGPTARIAYVQCAPDLDVWYVRCRVHLLVDGSDIDVGPGAGPKWSPDGSRVAFSGNSDYYEYGDGEILAARAVDGTVVNLTNHPAWDALPAWSPDGRIAFASNRDGRLELYVMNGDGSSPTRLTHDVGFAGSFVWSPDGSRIVFESVRDGAPELYTMGADGSNPSRLTYNSGFKRQVVWSADGTRIAFACEIETDNRDVCSINSDGTNFVRLTSDPAFDSGAVFSPLDGRLAFVSDGQMVVMDTDGTVTPVEPLSSGDQLAWSPNARQLAFVGTTTSLMGRCYFAIAHPADDFCMPVPDIYVVNLDGTGLTRIASGDFNIEWFTPPSGRPLAAFTYACAGSTCTFDASASADFDGTITSYAWNFGDGTNGAGTTTGHTYAVGRRYIVTLTVTDNSGRTGSVSMGVDANAPPLASFTVACSGGGCMFDASGSYDPDGTVKDYFWEFGDGTTGYGPKPTHSYATAGTFTVRLTVSDHSGLYSGTATRIENVTVLNTPPVASSTSTCNGLTCSFNASASSDADGTIASYAWSFGDGTTGSGAAVSHSYATAGTYTITLTVTDNAGGIGTRVQSVSVVLSDMHVGDLDGSSTSQQSRWTATVTIAVHDIAHGPVVDAVVSGVWNDGSGGSCTTNANGLCAASRSGLPKNTNSASFTVTNVVRSAFRYISGGNHDSDGDSNGTTIAVRRP